MRSPHETSNPAGFDASMQSKSIRPNKKGKTYMTDKNMTTSHVERDLMKKSGQFKLCEELQLILDKELKAGNTLLELPCCTNWPQEGSIFASLANRLTVGKEVLKDDVYYSINKDDVYYSINDDVHYGWIDECVFKIHHDLLVAGNLITNKHK